MSDSHVLAETPSVDLTIVTAMVEELEEYIIKDDLYRTLIVRTATGEVRLQMTGGDLLTRLHRLSHEGDRLSADQQQLFDRISQSAEKIIYSLKSRFNDRLQREMKARLDTLRWFLDERAGERGQARANYPYEIRNRQRVEEIVKRLGGGLPADLAEQLTQVDHRLRMLTTASEFVWDPALKSVFPQHPYWYLYVAM